MKYYLKLLRPKHYIKNILIFIPIFFAKRVFDIESLWPLLMGFCSFSFSSSVVYIINDMRDVENDRMHDVKKNRPIASGQISMFKAKVLAVGIGLLAIITHILALVGFNWKATAFLSTYLILNLAYSFGLKNVPIMDVSILASGFLLRIMYGAALSNVIASEWLYLTVISFSLYMGLGKRRNEIRNQQQSNTRVVLRYYTYEYLDKFMNICLTLTLVFYSLWGVNAKTEITKSGLLWTVPIVIIICMKYGLTIEGNSEGDPVEVLLSDKVLFVLVIIYAIIVFILLYGYNFFLMLK